MLSILPATCNRPLYPREALESVRRQTIRKAIARVVVSENGTNDDSRKVCAQFPDLPLLYVQRKPPVPHILHLKQIWNLVQTPLVATLHDDDWWAPEYLEVAVDALEAKRDGAGDTKNSRHAHAEAAKVVIMEQSRSSPCK
jgi:hypothetical protein